MVCRVSHLGHSAKLSYMQRIRTYLSLKRSLPKRVSRTHIETQCAPPGSGRRRRPAARATGLQPPSHLLHLAGARPPCPAVSVACAVGFRPPRPRPRLAGARPPRPAPTAARAARSRRPQPWPPLAGARPPRPAAAAPANADTDVTSRYAVATLFRSVPFLSTVWRLILVATDPSHVIWKVEPTWSCCTRVCVFGLQ